MKTEKTRDLKKKLILMSKLGRKDKETFAKFVQYVIDNPSPGDPVNQQEIGQYFDKVNSLFQHIRANRKGKLNLKVYNRLSHRQTYIDFSCDNMPFVVASLLNLLSQRGIYIYSQQNFTMGVSYKGNKISDILEEALLGKDPTDETPEIIVVRMAVEFLSDDERKTIALEANHLYHQIRRVSSDWQLMRANVFSVTQEYQYQHGASSQDESNKMQFLTWLTNNKCLFLGYSKYSSLTAKDKGKDKNRDVKPRHCIQMGPGLGICNKNLKYEKVQSMMNNIEPQEGIDFMKLPVMSLIHRKVYMQCISVGIKKGSRIEEHRFLLLYSFDFFRGALEEIPYIKEHFQRQLNRLNIRVNTYRWRVFRYALASYPRDEMMQVLGSRIFDRITDVIMDAFSATSFRNIVYYDKRRFFVNAAIFAPREEYSTEARHKFENLLRTRLNAGEGDFNVLFSEERLARVFLTMPLGDKSPLQINTAQLEREIIYLGIGWRYRLRHSLLKKFGDDLGIAMYKKYADIFGTSYRETFTGERAAGDLNAIIEVGSGEKQVDIELLEEKREGFYLLRLIGRTEDSSLSNLVRILENTGAEPIRSIPYFFSPCGEVISEVRLLEFSLDIAMDSGGVEKFKHSLEETLTNVYRGFAEDDRFNQLAISAALGTRDIMLLRAWSNYLDQAQGNFSRDYIRDTLCLYPSASLCLVRLFLQRFDPDLAKRSGREENKLNEEFDLLLEEVLSIEEDQILRCMRELIHSILRTNFYNHNESCLSFKLKPNNLSFCQGPQPEYEIFLYSADFEGAHLRDGPLARGGIRWSNKRAGYRNEIYQLVSAQIIKNAIIVPTGAKGGFYIKNPDSSAEEVYERFIEGLLEITDNYVKGKVVPAKGIRFYDDLDPYLVVAPDKGTADFSDLANDIAKRKNFWLQDAFASSGSTGYSHKKMGITARGAWESVRRGFAELGIDADKDPIEVIGVGDMSGDVFGNGMLLSRNMKVIAAFNHRNIFIDPNPDPRKSFIERRRLFRKQGSTWQDYDRKVLSKGGEIFFRADKRIRINDIIRDKFNISETGISPDKLIKHLLKSQADLLWFGGVGTYVKGAAEANLDLEDRPNDGVRVNGKDLRVKVVGEGANLGATLQGRIEFDATGGKIATDSNDNSGGVHCSDKEVNIKILLSVLQEQEKISSSARPQLLKDMTDDVSKSVLDENIEQNLSLSLERYESEKLFLHHKHLSDNLAANEIVGINEDTEYLSRPQLSILYGLLKNKIKEELAKYPLLAEESLNKVFLAYFPPRLSMLAGASAQKHFLAKEILNTQIANQMVDKLGLSFWDDLSSQDISQLDNYVLAFFDLDKMFNFSQLMNELPGALNQYPGRITSLIRLRQDLMQLVHYSVYFAPSALQQAGGFGLKYINECRKGSKIESAARSSTNRHLSEKQRLEIETAHQGINLLLGASLLITSRMYNQISPPAMHRLVEALDAELALDSILNLLDKFIQNSHQGIWQRKGISSLIMGILEQKQKILRSLLPSYAKLVKQNKSPTKAIDECLSKWSQDNRHKLSSYNECVSILGAETDLSKISYLLSVLSKI